MTGKQRRRLAPGSEIVLASHNAGKLREFRMLLEKSGILVRSAAELNLPEPEETETSFEGNARLKALTAAKASGLPALADDSGFCVTALDGAPGVYSARWAGPERDMGKAMARVHEAVEASGSTDRTASFRVVLCLAWPDGENCCIEGICEGMVTWPPRGVHGHGYDPIFVPQGETRRFAEMTEIEKNRFSHRGKAMEKFLQDFVHPVP